MLKRILLTTGLMVVIQAAAHAGQFAFKTPVHLRWNDIGDAVTIADFNGDGRDDLAAVAGGYLEVLLQNDDGVLENKIRFKLPSGYALTVREADLGADGTYEILVGHTLGLAVYKWTVVGGFAVDNHAAKSPCRYIATADLNLDGATDVFCHGHLGDATLYYSAQENALESPIYMLTPAYDPSGLAVFQAQLKDVTGDDKPDLLLAAGTSNSFFVYPHDGERSFLPGVAYPYPEEDDLWSDAIEVADLDGDGSNEVIVAKPCNRPCSKILIYKRGADGYLHLSKRLPTHDIPTALLIFDVDRDGNQDLLVGHSGWHSVGRYMGWAKALNTTELLSSVKTYGGSHHYALGDLNSDGFTDLAVANSFGVSVLYGGRRAADDFNGDFVSDVLWRHTTGRNAVWLSANRDTPQAIDSASPAWTVQATGDFDGNGVAEVFWRNGTTGANELWQSGYDPMPLTGVTDRQWRVVGAGDFDGDGRSDLLWRNHSTGANIIWKSGDSSTTQATSSVTDLRWEVAEVGDFDGDGSSDILWRHSASGRNVIWRAGRRTNQQALAGVSNLAWKVAGVGDFNGDGKDDVVWRNASTGANTIWLSANAATQYGVRAVTNVAWTIMAVGDYNGDGRSDLLWRHGTTGSNVIWRSANSKQQQSVSPVGDLRWGIIH
jgi:hypothetical protein